MDAIEALLTRRSVRSYDKERMPERPLLDRIAEAGTYAPTGMGAQSPIIIEVTDKTVRDRLSTLNATVLGTTSDPFYGAPVVYVVLADRSRPTYLYDGSLVMGNLLNAAHAVGLGSCWIHRAREVFDSAEGRALLREWGIEGSWEGIGHCIVGYPTGKTPAARPRKTGYIRYI